MRRLLVHPIFRWLLLIPLIAWPIAASQLVIWTHLGVLGEIGAILSGATHGSSQRSQSFGMDFYLRTDGGIDAISKPFAELAPIRPINPGGLLIASYAYDSPWPTDYGIVIQPVTLITEYNTLLWHNNSAISSKDELLRLAKTSERIDSEWPSYLPVTTNYGSFEPPDALWINQLSGESRYLTADVPFLFTELAYYTLFIWWIITLFYARKVWTKPDGTRCPTCNYETAGLTSQTCPECGNALPPSSSRGAHGV